MMAGGEDQQFDVVADSQFGEFTLLKIVVAARIFQMIYMRDLKTPSGEITHVSNFVWLVLIITYTGVGVTCLTIHGGFWIARTIVLMDIMMFVL
jgi:hypothetical protein